MPNTYAIVTIIRGKRYYWCRRNRTSAGGSWGTFHGATHFSAAERTKYMLPPSGQWVSVLHGFGPTPYPADSELV